MARRLQEIANIRAKQDLSPKPLPPAATAPVAVTAPATAVLPAAVTPARQKANTSPAATPVSPGPNPPSSSDATSGEVAQRLQRLTVSAGLSDAPQQTNAETLGTLQWLLRVSKERSDGVWNTQFEAVLRVILDVRH